MKIYSKLKLIGGLIQFILPIFLICLSYGYNSESKNILLIQMCIVFFSFGSILITFSLSPIKFTESTKGFLLFGNMILYGGVALTALYVIFVKEYTFLNPITIIAIITVTIGTLKYLFVDCKEPVQGKSKEKDNNE